MNFIFQIYLFIYKLIYIIDFFNENITNKLIIKFCKNF